MNTTSWVLIAVLLVAVVIMFPLTPKRVMGHPQVTPVSKTLPYRPSESMGSNKVSYPGLDTKALCAITDVCSL
jgi:hypothetical protein